MPKNVLEVGAELYAVLAGIVVLLAAALSFAFKYRATTDKAGRSGLRPADEAQKGEIARPDGFIDSFAGAISEAGGGVPFMATLIMLATFGTWLAYLIVNWKG